MRRASTLSLFLLSTVMPGALAACKHQGTVAGGASDADLSAQLGALAFGDADCGTTPVPHTISFHNTGTAALTFSARIEGTGFSITDGTGDSVLPGAIGSITIAADKVPSTSTVGQAIQATLIVETNASDAPISVPLSITAHGGSLVVQSTAVVFGQVPVSQTADQTFQISNGGDRAIQIAFGASVDPAFTGTWTGAPTAAAVAPGASLAGSTLHFTPSAVGGASGSVPIMLTGPFCAGATPQVVVSGQGTAVPVTITPGALAFGTTACGATAGDQTVTIKNDGASAITFTATIDSGPYTITTGQASGTVAANSTATIAVKANAVPKAPSSLTAGALAGAMTVSTSAAGSTPAHLTITQAATGAVLVTTPAGGQTLAFGDVAYGIPASMAFSVENTGNQDATITAGVTGAGFSTTTPGGGTIPANSTAIAGSVTATVAQSGLFTGSLAIATTTPLCQADVPPAITLTANGQAAATTIGAVPSMTSPCGVTTPAVVAINVSNSGTEPLLISAASATGGFTVTSSLPITIAVGASGSVSVRPPAAVVGTDAAASTKTGTLSLTTNEIGTPTRQVPLATTVTGAVLTLTPSPGSLIDFGNVDLGTPVVRTYSVKNAGNVTAVVTAATSGIGYTPIQTGPIAAGASASGSVIQTVVTHGTVAGTLSLASTTPQCAALPGSVSLTAFGRTPTAVIGAAPAMSAACGVTTPDAVNVTVQNTGDGPLVVTSASATGGFVVTTALPLTVAAGTSASLAVRPPSAVVGTDLGGATKTGSLTVVTNELTGSSHQVALSSTVMGANLSLANASGQSITSATFSTSGGCPGTQTIFVKNTGNASASVSITTPNLHGFQFYPLSPSATIAAGAQASHVLGVWTLNDDKCVESEVISYTATGSVCTALPFTLQATATIGSGTTCYCS